MKCRYRFHLKEKLQNCIKHECIHYQDVLGTNPQTGEAIKEYMCSDLLHNLLIIENSKMQREMGAAIESFRNEMVKSQGRMVTSIESLKSGAVGRQNKPFVEGTYFPSEKFIPNIENDDC